MKRLLKSMRSSYWREKEYRRCVPLCYFSGFNDIYDIYQLFKIILLILICNLKFSFFFHHKKTLTFILNYVFLILYYFSREGVPNFPVGGHGNPLQYFCLENSIDREAWKATVHRATKRHDWSDWARTSLIYKFRSSF